MVVESFSIPIEYGCVGEGLGRDICKDFIRVCTQDVSVVIQQVVTYYMELAGLKGGMERQVQKPTPPPPLTPAPHP